MKMKFLILVYIIYIKQSLIVSFFWIDSLIQAKLWLHSFSRYIIIIYIFTTYLLKFIPNFRSFSTLKYFIIFQLIILSNKIKNSQSIKSMKNNLIKLILWSKNIQKRFVKKIKKRCIFYSVLKILSFYTSENLFNIKGFHTLFVVHIFWFRVVIH